MKTKSVKSFKFARFARFLRNVVVVLSFSFLVLSFISPVLAKIPSGICCDISADCPEGNYVCDRAVDPDCQAQGKKECFLIEVLEKPKEGIYNPVIDLFGIQPGELTIAHILATFLRLSLVAAGILLLIYLVMGGIQWLTSGGEKTAVAAARDRMTNAFIGLMIIVLVLVVIAIINEVFHLNILQPELPTP